MYRCSAVLLLAMNKNNAIPQKKNDKDSISLFQNAPSPEKKLGRGGNERGKHDASDGNAIREVPGGDGLKAHHRRAHSSSFIIAENKIRANHLADAVEVSSSTNLLHVCAYVVCSKWPAQTQGGEGGCEIQ